jgi:hypothetical protein
MLSPQHASGSLKNAARRGVLALSSHPIREATLSCLKTAKNRQKRIVHLTTLPEVSLRRAHIKTLKTCYQFFVRRHSVSLRKSAQKDDYVYGKYLIPETTIRHFIKDLRVCNYHLMISSYLYVMTILFVICTNRNVKIDVKK